MKLKQIYFGIKFFFFKMILKTKGLTYGKNFRTHSLDISTPRKLSIGDNVWIGPRAHIVSDGGVIIKNDAIISGEISIISADHGIAKSKLIRLQALKTPKAPIVIEEGAWICAKAIVLKEVKIGKGAIVGAGAVITKNVAAFTIVAGNPARVVGKRK